MRAMARGREGYTIVEVVVAATILALAATGVLQGMIVGERSIRNAGSRQEASHVASEVANRLIALTPTVNRCDGTADPLVADTFPGNSMRCFGAGTEEVPGARPSDCVPDHPVDAMELNALLGTEFGVLGNDQVFLVNDDFGGSELGGVRYAGRHYRVVWNVECGVPAADQRWIKILVGWGDPRSAMVGGRYVELTVGKGFGL